MTCACRPDAGFTQKAPRWAIALKYPRRGRPPASLLHLVAQWGRTGVITPVAEFRAGDSGRPQPVSGPHIAQRDRPGRTGSTHDGDTVVVRKAARFIPEVVRGAERAARARRQAACSCPSTCPECGL